MSLAASWLTQHAQQKGKRHEHTIERRETLYKNCIEGAARLYADACEQEKTELSNLVRLFAMINRVRVLSSPKVVQHADRIGRLIIETYLAPNRTFHDTMETIQSETLDAELQRNVPR